VAVDAFEDDDPAATGAIQPWELHSELALVCPEVGERARELLPERDPDAFLCRPRELPLPVGAAEAERSPNLPTAVIGYTLWRLVETVWCALAAVGAVVALALLADAVH
jgi:hypothetical protein